MKKVLFMVAIAAIVVCLSAPAFAQDYLVNWSENFDGYNCAQNNGDLWGQGGWVSPTTTGYVSPKLRHGEQYTSAEHAERQPVGTKSAAWKDLRSGNAGGLSYKEGYVMAWVWDPYTTALTTATRFGAQSAASTSGAAGNQFLLALEDAQTRSYWCAGWMTFLKLDGVMTGVVGVGYTWTAVKTNPAPRSAGWSFAFLYWSYNYPAGTCHVDFYVNQTDNPNAMLDFNTTAARWANTPSIAGVFLGDTANSTAPAYIDDLMFGGNPIPEPSSLMALGTGMLGLLGLIRRRR